MAIIGERGSSLVIANKRHMVLYSPPGKKLTWPHRIAKKRESADEATREYGKKGIVY
jgi:hypothetical protein